jgi:uncharacterized membrane protein YqjE
VQPEAELQRGKPGASIRDDLRRAGGETREIVDEIAGIADDLRQMLATEVDLAKAEVREQLQLAVRVAVWGGVAAVAALLTLGWLALTATYALDVALPLWLSAALVAAALALVAAICAIAMRSKLRQVNIMPERTVRSVKEDVVWAKQQLKSNTKSSAGATP